MLLGRAPDDFDITTQAEPDAVAELFSSYQLVEAGRKHGTIGVVVDGKVYEVTTYRVDGEYSDNRRPDEVAFTRSLSDDVMRRDLTVNAIAMDRRGEIRDPAGGLDDLKAGVLRAVGEPHRRFEEDALRILRTIRFEAQLAGFGFRTDPATEQAVHDCRDLLRNIAAERIRIEFDKLLMADHAVEVLGKYSDVIAVFLPEIRDSFGFDQQNPFHCYDVWEHILHAVAAAPADLVVRLAALLHDVGKPSCFIVKDGWGHFYGHEAVSADMAGAALRRLKYDNRTIDAVTELISVHGTVFNLSEKYARRKLRKFGEERLFQLIALERADVSAQAYEVREERVASIDAFEDLVRREIERDACFSLKDLAVNGTDIIALGAPRGPAVGAALDALLSEVVDGKLPNDRDALIGRAKQLISESVDDKKTDNS
jgi:tRNA nucleotidyltransferase (CCA-adding enzyme)